MTVLQKLTGAGVRMELSRDDLIVRPQAPLTDDQLDFIREHKAELVTALKEQRRCRRDEILMLLADNPHVRYAYTVADASSDPVIIAVGIRDLATFEMSIPAECFEPWRLLALIDDANGADTP